MRLFVTRALLVTSLSLLLACSAAQDRGSPGGSSGSGAGGGSGGSSAGSGGSSPGTDGSFGFGGGISTGGTSGAGAACATEKAEGTLMREPVDIILVVDNSGSMRQELQSVENNINANFGSILTDSGVDYRLIAISRHRDDDNTSLCVTQPLSSLASCPAPDPGLTERFKHFNTKIESDDSLDRILATYEPGFDECFSMCDNGDTSEDDGDDNSGNTDLGWSEWLRAGAKKVFLVMTDANDDLPAADFVSHLTTMAPEFGTAASPQFIFHSITGLAEKTDLTAPYLPDEPVQSVTCMGDVTNAGETYQELSRMTGGLRFPLCQYAGYDVVFRTIAEDVVTRSTIACDFAIPPAPAGRELDLAKVAVNYTPGDGTAPIQFGQAATSAACQSNAFYIQDSRIWICPETCATIQADPNAAVDVLFTCESQIIE